MKKKQTAEKPDGHKKNTKSKPGLNFAERKRLVKLKRQLAGSHKNAEKPTTAQKTITFKKMYRDGICQVTSTFYTKMVEFYDINYDLLEIEDKGEILEEYSRLINYFDPSIKFELFLFNRQVNEQTLIDQFDIPLQGDDFDDIVTQEEFDIVQQLITSRRLPQNKGGFVNIFAGVIKCVDCGCALRAMNVHRRKRPEIIDCVQYSCNNYARNGRSECSAHNIEARDLFNAVLADINCFADMAVNDEKAVRAIEKRLTETDQSRAKALEKERKKLNKRLAELDRLFSSLYEDKVMERITERNFEMMSGKYQKEQLEIEARLKEVTETLNESYEKSRGIRDFLALIRNYQGLKELDATVINALIDKILVSEREKMADGTVKQEIKIYYKFIGFVDELHIIPTKRWAAMPAKNCTVCGVEYVPGSGASRYCPACAKKIRREKSNESKRRSREQKRIACMNCPQKMTD